MRLLLLTISFAFISTVGPLGMASVLHAQAQECTGENCPPPEGTGGGRDCESKKESVTS